MDWNGAIGRKRRAVLALLAALPVLLALAPGPLRRAMRGGILSLLRPLESCARMLALALLHARMRPLLDAPPRHGAGRGKARRSGPSSGGGFALLAAGERLAMLRPRRTGIRRGGAPVAAGDPGRALARRVAALRAVLGDLPGLARRLARVLGRRGRRPGRGAVAMEAVLLPNALAGPGTARAFAPP